MVNNQNVSELLNECLNQIQMELKKLSKELQLEYRKRRNYLHNTFLVFYDSYTEMLKIKETLNSKAVNNNKKVLYYLGFWFFLYLTSFLFSSENSDRIFLSFIVITCGISIASGYSVHKLENRLIIYKSFVDMYQRDMVSCGVSWNQILQLCEIKNHEDGIRTSFSISKFIESKGDDFENQTNILWVYNYTRLLASVSDDGYFNGDHQSFVKLNELIENIFSRE